MPPTIKHIIFDLGGVFLSLDFARALQSMHAIGVPNFHEHWSGLKQSSLFDDLETGRVTPELFITKFQHACGIDIDAARVEHALNAVLGEMLEARLQQAYALKNSYQLFLLSNTNAIHYAHISKLWQQLPTHLHPAQCFEKAYFSHEIGMRKPDHATFKYVLDKHHLQPHETLFVDDFEYNITSAKDLGLHTLHFDRDQDLSQLQRIL